jgi:hypothetical protein
MAQGYGGLSHANIEWLRNHLGDHWSDADTSEWIFQNVTTVPAQHDVSENDAFVLELVRRGRPLAADRLKQLLTEQRPR